MMYLLYDDVNTPSQKDAEGRSKLDFSNQELAYYSCIIENTKHKSEMSYKYSFK